MRRTVAALSAAPWIWAALVAVLDRWARLDVRDVEPERDGPLVSVIVPARNEERGIGRAVASLVGQEYGPTEVIVVDDESTDRTAERAATAGGRVLAGEPLPEGWVGKSWACHQGVQVACGEWLLFTDADVIHAPEALGLALALARREGRGGLTILCRLDSGSAAERVVQPTAVVLIRSFVAPGFLIRSRRSKVALAAGGFILIQRTFYDRIGGHEAIRGRLIDDQALAQAAKAAGGLLVPAFAGELVRVRMYEGPQELWRGWRKNTSVGLVRGSTALALAGGLAGAVVSVAPPVALALGPRRAGAVGVAAQLLARADVDEIAPSPPAYWATLPLGALFLSLVSLRSSLDRLRGGVEWRGRRYD